LAVVLYHVFIGEMGESAKIKLNRTYKTYIGICLCCLLPLFTRATIVLRPHEGGAGVLCPSSDLNDLCHILVRRCGRNNTTTTPVRRGKRKRLCGFAL